MINTTPASALQEEVSAGQEVILASLWSQFNTQFQTESDCLEELYQRACTERLLKCRHCGGLDLERHYGARIIKCRRCKKKAWFTAGTLFNRMRLAKPWLAAIWLMEHGVILSSLRFHKLVGIAQSSALNILRKITTVIHNHLMTGDASTAHSSLFSQVFCKRSRETPARAHPLAEQGEIEKRQLDSERINQCSDNGDSCRDSSAFGAPNWKPDPESLMGASLINTDEQATAINNKLCGKEKEVYDCLSETPLHVDTLGGHIGMPVGQLAATLMMLELSGIVTRLAGDRYIRCIPQPACASAVQLNYIENPKAELTMIITTIVNFIRCHFHGISRKYLQNYVAAYWCHIARERWHQGLLLQACLRFGPISYKQILDYVSPALIKLSPC